jgi:hypothetical protein
MIKIIKPKVEAELRAFVGADTYIHREATSFVFVRNFKVKVTMSLLRGKAPFVPLSDSMGMAGCEWRRLHIMR